MIGKLENKILFLALASILFLFLSTSALAIISSFYPTSATITAAPLLTL